MKNNYLWVRMWVRVVLSGGKWSKVGESMLTGEYRHSIDEKGRLIIPAKYRDILGDNFVVTKGLDSCLFIYPNDEWTSFENKLRGLPLTNQNARHFSRFFLGVNFKSSTLYSSFTPSVT